MLLEGIFLPLTTPFQPDGRLFLHKLEANVARYSLTPAAGMLVGRDGAESLSDEETRALLGAAMHRVSDEKVMLAAVGRGSLARTLALADCAATAGYDVVTVGLPAGLTHPESLNFLMMVADRSPLPVVLDGVPNKVVTEIAGHANVLGAIGSGIRVTGVSREVTVTGVFLAATGRMLRRGAGLVQVGTPGGSGAALKTRSRKVGFQVLEGSTIDMLRAWREGANGALPGLGACAPQACCEVWQAYKDGDAPLAEEKQARLVQAAAVVENAAKLRYGCDVNGYYGGPPRLPFFACDADGKGAVERVLRGLRN